MSDFMDNLPKELSDREKKEFEFDEQIKAELHDICTYMWEHGLKQISMGYSSGARFRLRMEFEEGSR